MMKINAFASEYGILTALHEVTRWAWLPMRRKQSVAEHQYNVMVISQALYDYLYPVPHNSNDRALLLEWAMWHDADEYFTTDMPSPLKRQLEVIMPGALERLVTDKFQQLPGSRYLGLKNSVKGQVVELVVKLADIAEALAYFYRYSVDQDRIVDKFLRVALEEQLTKLMSHPHKEWEWKEAEIINFLYAVIHNEAGEKLLALRHRPVGERG
jgi:5'-deoxynucleotidase YfbR-like HD superfamily hydrolase